MSNLHNKLLLGRQFWRRHGLILDLEANQVSVKVGEPRQHGPIRCRVIQQMTEALHKLIGDGDVDHLCSTIVYHGHPGEM